MVTHNLIHQTSLSEGDVSMCNTNFHWGGHVLPTLRVRLGFKFKFWEPLILV